MESWELYAGLGAMALVLITCTVALVCRRRRRQTDATQSWSPRPGSDTLLGADFLPSETQRLERGEVQRDSLSTQRDQRALSAERLCAAIRPGLSPIDGVEEIPYLTLYRSCGGFARGNVIGTGGFGKVYRAQVSSLPVVAAIKRLHNLSSDGIAQVWAEIVLLGSAACRHEGLLPLLGYCLDQRAPCLVYPLMTGGDLEERIFSRRRPALQWWERLHILRSVADALHFLHTPSKGKGVVLHRDIKPARRDSNPATTAPTRRAGKPPNIADMIILHRRTFCSTRGSTLGCATWGSPRRSPTGRRDARTRRRATLWARPATSTRWCAALPARAAHARRSARPASPQFVETLQSAPRTDSYAFGITLLVALTGKRASDADNRAAAEVFLSDVAAAPRCACPIGTPAPVC